MIWGMIWLESGDMENDMAGEGWYGPSPAKSSLISSFSSYKHISSLSRHIILHIIPSFFSCSSNFFGSRSSKCQNVCPVCQAQSVQEQSSSFWFRSSTSLQEVFRRSSRGLTWKNGIKTFEQDSSSVKFSLNFILKGKKWLRHQLDWV